MQVILHHSAFQTLYVYIHCMTAGEQFKLSAKMYTHSEYKTEWSELLEKWQDKEYYKYYNEKQMASRNDVVTILEFTNCSGEDSFIQEICSRFQDEYSGGYLITEYKTFNHQ